MIIDIIIIGIILLILYYLFAWISHYEGTSFGRPVPWWLCIFCLIEKIKGDKNDKTKIM